MAKKKTSIVELELARKVEELERENAQLRGSESNYGIRLDEYIEVMSLVDYKLNLSTEPLGRGRQFSFSKFGEIKRILYNDLASIFENYRRFMEEGYFYILSDKVVRKHGLDDLYSKLLTKEMIEQVVACNPKTAVKFYESASAAQRETIDGMLIKSLKEGNPDLNIVAKISKISGKDLIKIADESKALEAIPVQQQ